MIIYYLYVKTHRITGLKYLGQTKKDPLKYKGSGLDWLTHIKQYGYDVHTEILLTTDSQQERNNWGRYYSKLWNIVESDQWANLKEESGDGGDPGKVGREKISKTLSGRTLSEDTCKKLSQAKLGKKQKKCSEQGRLNIKAANQGKNLGRVLSEETKAKIRASNRATWAKNHPTNGR
jgi:hypothetical protein